MYSLISKKTGKIYKVREGIEYHCKEGKISKEDIESGNKIVKSNKGTEFLVTKANPYDIRSKIKRGPQILIEKDLGYIIARTGVDKNSFIVEAGGGSGAGTTFFSKFVEKVHSYEERENFIEIIKENIDLLGGEDNVKIFNKKIEDGIENEENVDLLFLDLPQPWEVLEKNLDAIKDGKYIVCYLPSMLQIHKVVEKTLDDDRLHLEEINEVNIREWIGKEKVLRPENKKEIDFTAFLVFIRKL